MIFILYFIVGAVLLGILSYILSGVAILVSFAGVKSTLILVGFIILIFATGYFAVNYFLQ